MAWAGGTFTRANGANEWVTDFANGVGIEPARHDTQDNDLATGINNCLTKDGQNTPNANLPMGGFKHTGVANGSARTDYAAVGQAQDGDFVWLGTTGGTATAQTASATPAITAYKAGQKFRMKIGSGLGSTGSTATAHTININSLGAKNIVNNEDASNPTLGTWIGGAIMELIYDGTNFVITNDPGGWIDWSLVATPGGTMTFTSITYSRKKFRKIGKIVHMSYQLDGTTGGTASTFIELNLPVNASITSSQAPIAGFTYDSSWQVANVVVISATTLRHYKDAASSGNFALAAGKYITATVTYAAV